MVHSDDIIAHELEDTTDAISLNGWAQVADMHVLRNVWWWEIDQNALLLLWSCSYDRLLWLFLCADWSLSCGCWYVNMWGRSGPGFSDLIAESTDEHVPSKGSRMTIGMRWVVTESHVIVDIFSWWWSPAQPLSLLQSSFDRVCKSWTFRLLNCRSLLFLFALPALSFIKI